MQRWGMYAVLLVGCGSSGNNATCPPNAICVDAQPGTGDGPHGTIDAPNNPLIDAMSMVDVPGGVGEPPDLMGMTLYHNQVRAAVDTTGIAAGPLPALQWDPNLATYAATWAAMCNDTNHDGLVDHNPNRTNVAGYAYIGENIFAAGGQTATAMQAVTGWADEKADYTYATNTCAAGKVCGHYTQLVWRATLFVGCALQNCPSLMYPSTIVCDYGPGGNYNGESPY